MENIISGKSVPVKNAERIIKEYGFSLPKKLDLELIANAEKIIVEETLLENLLGKIIYNSDCGLIKINSNIKETGQKRFTLAHELGHYFNEFELRTNPFYRHADRYLTFNSSSRFEDDANEFAAELLMHRPWFNNFCKNKKINMELIKEIALYFNVSLSAAAFRYTNIGKYPTAIIYSTNGVVKWKALHDYFPFKFIRHNSLVPKASAAYDFFNGREMQTCDDLIEAKYWFPEDRNIKTGIYLYEQNTAMPYYNSVLTLLWEDK